MQPEDDYTVRRMRRALRTSTDPTLPATVRAISGLADHFRTIDLLNAAHVNAYFVAFGKGLRYVPVELVMGYIPGPEHYEDITIERHTSPTPVMFLYGLSLDRFNVMYEDDARGKKKKKVSPAAALFDSMVAQVVPGSEMADILVGILCLAAYKEDPAIAIPAAKAGYTLDPQHPHFLLTLGQHSKEPAACCRAGRAATHRTAPLYATIFQALLDVWEGLPPRETLAHAYQKELRPWVPDYIDRVLMRPFFDVAFRAMQTHDYLNTAVDAFTCDACGGFATQLYRGACSPACRKALRQGLPEARDVTSACAALALAVAEHRCRHCNGPRSPQNDVCSVACLKERKDHVV